jgi:hypothetical protein
MPSRYFISRQQELLSASQQEQQCICSGLGFRDYADDTDDLVHHDMDVDLRPWNWTRDLYAYTSSTRYTYSSDTSMTVSRLGLRS